MTQQEIDRIECAIRHIQSSLDVDPWAMDIAVAAMKKQIPRKPKIIDDHWHLCPYCYEKKGFSYDYLVGMKQRGQDDVSFCLGCGQAIDWSEWEDEDEQI
jgi:hypothetical protein